jgi:hypothetical protein
MKTKQQYREFLDELVSEYCQHNKYCLLKEFLISAHPDPRLLMQLKALEKYKYQISQQADKEISWQETMEKWVETGLAKKFADAYDKDNEMPFKTLYKKIMNGNGNGNGK